MPFYKNSSIEKYCFSNDTDEGLLVTNEIDDIDNYPNIKEHLLKYKPILDARYRNFALINADKEGKWYYLYGYRPNTNFEGKKIVTPYRSKGNKFSFSESPLYASIDIFYIDIFNKDIKEEYVLGILNSDLILYWLQKNCKKKGEILELYTEPLSNIPIPNDNESKYKEEISRKTSQLITLKKQLINKVQSEVEQIILKTDILSNYEMLANEINQEKEALNNLNYEINQLVFKLFDISSTEKDQIYSFLKSINMEDTFESELITLDKEYLEEKIALFLRCKIKEYFVVSNNPKSLMEITGFLQNTFHNFLDFIEVLNSDNQMKSYNQLVSQVLKGSSDTINQFVKKKSDLKPIKQYVKYDSDIYGLSDWSDEVHRKYFTDVLEYYTSTSNEKFEGTVFEGVGKTKKKAETALKNLEKLEFEDKEEYLKILTDKVKKAFD